MFEANYKEVQENRMEITDFEPKIVKKMIEFFETDNVQETAEDEVELYKIANKYEFVSFMVGTLLLTSISVNHKHFRLSPGNY